MRIAMNLLVGAAFMAALAGCGQTAAPTTPSAATLNGSGLQYYWSPINVSLAPGERIAKMWRLDENLYFLTNSHRLVCYEAARGLLRWSQQIAAPQKTVFAPCHAVSMTIPRQVPGSLEIMGEGVQVQPFTFKPVLINTLDRLLVFDRTTGEKMRDIKLPFAANTAGACDGSRFYVADTNGYYHVVDVANALVAVSRSAQALVKVPPVVRGIYVYVGNTDGMVFVADNTRLENPAVATRKLGGAVNVPMTVNDLGWFVSCEDNQVYALDPATAKTRSGWVDAFSVKGQIRNAAQVGTKTVFQYVQGDTFYAINAANGQKRWDLPGAIAVVGATNNTLYILDNANRLQVVDELLGKSKTTVPMGGYELYVANATSPVMYVATRSGKAACIVPEAVGPLSLEKFTSTQPAP